MEAEIVAKAGQKGQVTIATNMAGRGTDIVLGEGVKELGGLHIIGTERHESRRIDNQLRGRSGRQGDPGSSRFYVSLEDDLMRLFGSDNIGSIMDKVGMDDTTPINHPLISRSIETAQKRIEARNFDIRKHVLEYDDVINQQREVIYKQRRQVLEGENLKDTVMDMIDTVIDSIIESYAVTSQYPEEWDLKGMLNHLEQLYLPKDVFIPQKLAKMDKEEIISSLKEKAYEIYENKEDELGSEMMRELERYVILKVVDQKWMDHIDAMDQLRQGIGLRAYGQKDPLVEYKYEGYEMFNRMISEIQEDTVRYVFTVNIVEQPRQRAVNIQENKQESESKKQPARSKKVGRNDPCPCGSGKKYKKCCGS
jgi:preprotein translocase subunit SecA